MSQLPNYLRAYRKQVSLSQEEVAFLMGQRGGADVCRFERFERPPNLHTALALSIILQKPLEQVFAGTCRKIEQQVAVRAKSLGFQKDRQNRPQQMKRRRETLQRLAALSERKS